MLYNALVFLHLAGVLGFVAAHGVTAAVALRLRTERSLDRIRTLLDLSASTRRATLAGLGLLAVGGGLASLHAGQWHQPWVIVSTVLLVVLVTGAVPLIPYYRAVRVEIFAIAAGVPDRQAELDALLSANRPVVIAVGETVGIMVILGLMVFQPS